MTDADETRLMLRVGRSVAGNVALFAAFSVVFVKQYHMTGNLSDVLDEVLAPWGWFAGFFIVSFYAVRRPVGYAIAVALVSALVFGGIFCLFVECVLVPRYDPMF